MADTTLHYADTPVLRIAYETTGDDGAPPVLLLHGWPDDVRTWDAVVGPLVAAGHRTIVPHLRGYGPTTFREAARVRSGQVVAYAQDAVDLLDALGIGRVTLVGHDWGARAGHALGALFPRRIERSVILSGGYETGIPAGEQIDPEQGRAYWYQWFLHTTQGRQMLTRDPERLCRYLWRTWSPDWRFTDDEFATTARSWLNRDWAEVTLHAYRVRWGAAPTDPAYAALEAALAPHPPITVPTTLLHGADDGASLAASSAGQEASFVGGYRREVLAGVGHFVQRERPEAVVAAVLARQA